MPLRFTCYAFPGDVSGSSDDAIQIYLVGLDPSTCYRFSCEVASARLVDGVGAVGMSAKSHLVFPDVSGSAHIVEFELELEADDSSLPSLFVDDDQGAILLGAIFDALSQEVGVRVCFSSYELIESAGADGRRRAGPKRCFGDFIGRFRFDFVLQQRRNEDKAKGNEKQNENEKHCLGAALEHPVSPRALQCP